MTSNPSFKRSASGRTPDPQLVAMYLARFGPGVLPLSPARFEC